MKTALKTTTLSIALILGMYLQGFAGNDSASGTKSKTSMVISQGKTVNPGEVVTASILATDASQAQAIVTNVKGQTVLDMKVELAEGQNQIRIRLGELSSGVYFLKLVSDGNTQTRSFYVH